MWIVDCETNYGRRQKKRKMCSSMWEFYWNAFFRSISFGIKRTRNERTQRMIIVSRKFSLLWTLIVPISFPPNKRTKSQNKLKTKNKTIIVTVMLLSTHKTFDIRHSAVCYLRIYSLFVLYARRSNNNNYRFCIFYVYDCSCIKRVMSAQHKWMIR